MVLEVVVAQPADVSPPLDGVVARYLRPVAGEVEARFRFDPGLASRVADQGIAEPVDVDRGNPPVRGEMLTPDIPSTSEAFVFRSEFFARLRCRRAPARNSVINVGEKMCV